MQIVEMDVNDLNEYENNPRLNNDAVEYVNGRGYGGMAVMGNDLMKCEVCGEWLGALRAFASRILYVSLPMI